MKRKAQYWMYKKTKFNGHWHERHRATILKDWICIFIAFSMIAMGVYNGVGALAVFGVVYFSIIMATWGSGGPPKRKTPPIDWDKKLADMRSRYENGEELSSIIDSPTKED